MNIETMEGRTLFSVTVTEGYPGFYEIHGTEYDDVIEVSVDMDAETFTLDDVTYTGVAYICVDSGAGDDTIMLLAGSEGYIGAAVSAGDGNDLIAINFDGSIWAGEGDDTLDLSNAFHGEVYGEGGNDQIYVYGESTSPEIHGGDGDDYIDVSYNNYGVTVYAGDGNDVVIGSIHNDRIYAGSGADVILGNDGHDAIYSGDDNSQDHIDGGSGNDTLYSNGYEITILSIELIL